jgi:large subunit ribosomal protein L29
MKAKEIKNLHAKTIAELENLLSTAQKELVKLRMDQATRKLKDTHQILKIRHNIARIKTIIREKELSE